MTFKLSDVFLIFDSFEQFQKRFSMQLNSTTLRFFVVGSDGGNGGDISCFLLCFMFYNNPPHSNLEVLQNQTDGSVRGTLFWVLNETSTAFGARMLR